MHRSCGAGESAKTQAIEPYKGECALGWRGSACSGPAAPASGRSCSAARSWATMSAAGTLSWSMSSTWLAPCARPVDSAILRTANSQVALHAQHGIDLRDRLPAPGGQIPVEALSTITMCATCGRRLRSAPGGRHSRAGTSRSPRRPIPLDRLPQPPWTDWHSRHHLRLAKPGIGRCNGGPAIVRERRIVRLRRQACRSGVRRHCSSAAALVK